MSRAGSRIGFMTAAILLPNFAVVGDITITSQSCWTPVEWSGTLLILLTACPREHVERRLRLRRVSEANRAARAGVGPREYVERCPSGLRSTLGNRSSPAARTHSQALQRTRDQRLNPRKRSRGVH